MKKRIKYKLREDSFDSYVSYGIDIICNKAIVRSIKDISLNKNELSSLIEKCNRLKLSEIHIYDVIDDFLST